MVVYKTQRQVLKHLNCNEYIALKALCRYSKDMYNITLYSVSKFQLGNITSPSRIKVA